MATTTDVDAGVDFDQIEDASDHCIWLSECLDKAGGELVVRYHKMSAEERKRRQQEQVLADKRAQLKRLKEELGEP